MSLNTHPELAGPGSWGDAALPAPPAPVPFVDAEPRERVQRPPAADADAAAAAGRISLARADYHAALMSDPSAPGYDRLCSLAEERVRDLEDEAAPPVAADAQAQVAGPRDFSALLQPRRRSASAHHWTSLVRSTQAAAAAAQAVAADGQAALDRQWDAANIGCYGSSGGCPFCDSIMGGCSCWRERAEAHRLQERRERKARQAAAAAAVAAGTCSCDLEFSPEEIANGAACQLCQEEEANCCDYCGQLTCRPECCGACGACENCRGPPCSRCHEDQDRCCHEDDQDAESECEEERYARWQREYWETGF